jgi:hypothetical protein
MTTTAPNVPLDSPNSPDSSDSSVRTTPAPTGLARAAGFLGLAQVVIMFAAITQEVMVDHDTPPAELLRDYGAANLTRAFAGGYLEALSFLILVPALVIIARVFSRGSEVTRAAAQSFLALGIVWVAATMAVGFAPGAAAMYAAHHGADARSIAMVNDIRNFGYLLQVTVQGAMAVALGVAAILGRQWNRFVGWGGVAVGTAVLVGTPFAHNALGMLWLLWWVPLMVLLIRGRRTQAA